MYNTFGCKKLERLLWFEVTLFDRSTLKVRKRKVKVNTKNRESIEQHLRRIFPNTVALGYTMVRSNYLR